MRGLELWFNKLISGEESPIQCDNYLDASESFCFTTGGLFLQQSLPFASLRTSPDHASRYFSMTCRSDVFGCGSRRRGMFMSVSLSSVKASVECVDQEPGNILRKNGDRNISEDEMMAFKMVDEGEKVKKEKVKLRGGASAFNTTKHLWAGAVSAMVSRFGFRFYTMYITSRVCA